MNRLPPALPARWLDQLLPARPTVRPGQQPAWRPPATTPASAAPRPGRVHGRPAPAAQQEAGASRAGLSVPNEQPAEYVLSGHGGEGAANGGEGDEQAEQGQGDPSVSGSVSDSAATCDALDIAALLPPGDCSGIFEVHLPDGQVMGVAVDSGPASVSYHLKPAGKGLADRLRSQQRELKSHLQRRIGKDVTLTIL